MSTQARFIYGYFECRYRYGLVLRGLDILRKRKL